MNPDGLNPELSGRHGIYDLSGLQISRHANQRFMERFQGIAESEPLGEALAEMLRSCRKLGVKQDGASAYIAVYGETPVVLIEQNQVILTFMTQDQFESVMVDFGRNRWPRKPGRWLKRIRNSRVGKWDDHPLV